MYSDIVATMYFSEKIFSQTILCFKYVFNLLQISKIQRYSKNAIIMANVFKYLPRSEAAVYMCSLKRCSEVFSIIHREVPGQESLLGICVDF